MGTHPIFESDFDCLTDKKSKSAEMAKVPQKSKEAKAKAASGGGKKSKKKWSKGKSRDKLQNMCLFDKPTYDRVLKEVPNYKVITPINRVRPHEDPRIPCPSRHQGAVRAEKDQTSGPAQLPDGLHSRHRR